MQKIRPRFQKGGAIYTGEEKAFRQAEQKYISPNFDAVRAKVILLIPPRTVMQLKALSYKLPSERGLPLITTKKLPSHLMEIYQKDLRKVF